MRAVLSIDGGGIRGIFAARVCQALEDELGPLHEAFDLIAGTSTGGVLAIGLGLGMHPSEILSLYHQDGPRIFRKSRWRRIKTLWGVEGPRYEGKVLEQALRTRLRSMSLSHCMTRVMVYTYSLAEGQAVARRSWRDMLPAWQAAYETSAAPTFFPPRDGFIDGGIYANNPAVDALAEAVDLWPDDRRFVVSVGTGASYPSWDPIRGGYREWGPVLPSIMMDGVSDVTDRRMNALSIPGLYARLQVPIQPVRMDDASSASRAYLERVAHGYVDTHRDLIRSTARAIRDGRGDRP